MTRSRIDTLVPAALAIILVSIGWVLERSQVAVTAFLPEHVIEFGMRSSRYQFLAYAALLGVLALAFVAVIVKRSPPGVIPDRIPDNRVVALMAAALWGTLVVFGERSPLWVGGFVFGLVSFALLRGRRHDRWAKLASRLLVVGGGLYVLACVLVPFITPIVVRYPAQLVEINSHYSMTVMPGFDLAGEGSIERSNYGAGMTLLVALPYKLLPGLAAEHEGGLIFIVRFYQVVTLVLVCWTMYVVNRKHAVWLAGLAILINPTLDTLGEALVYPNQAGIRYIPFVIGVLVLARQATRERASIPVLGIAGGIVAVLSPECGVAVSAGFAAYIALVKLNVSRPMRSAARSIFGFVVVFVPVFVGLSFLATRLFDAAANAGPFDFLKLFSSGYGALVTRLSIFAALLVFVGAHALLRGALIAKRGPIPPMAAYQAGLGVMILAWLPYYINRMSEWNLWFHGVLVVLLFAPSAPGALAGALREPFRFRAFYVATTFALIVGLAFSAAGTLIRDSYTYMRLHRAGCTKELGIFRDYCSVEGPTVDASVLLAELDPRDTLVLSHLSAGARLRGFNPSFPWYEPFGEVQRTIDMETVRAWIDRNGPRYLVLDAPSSELSRAVGARSRHLQSIGAGLLRYKQLRHDETWLYFERIVPASN